MGCDIHVYVEYRKPTGYYKEWRSLTSGKFWVERNYHMFGKLAGVRSNESPIVSPQPIPTDLSNHVAWDYYLFVVDQQQYDRSEDKTGMCSPEMANRYVNELRLSQQHPERKNLISNPDWHSAGCVTPAQWRKATHVRGEMNDPSTEAIYAACKALEKQEFEVRVVFWFDN